MNTSDMKKYFLNFCGALIIFIFTAFLLIVSYGFQKISQEATPNKILAITLTIVTTIIMILILSKIYNDGILNKSYKKISIKSFLNYSKKYVLLTLSLVIISVLFANVISAIISKLTQGYDLDIELDITFYIIEAILFAPFIEELMFRGLFFNITFNMLDMEDKVVKYLTIIINIMLFMMLHYIGYGFPKFDFLLSLSIAMLPRLAVSISLLYIYFKTKDIKYNIIFHMLYNFIFVSLAFII